MAAGKKAGLRATGSVIRFPGFLAVYREGGEARALPCAEVVLGDRAAEALMEIRTITQRT